MGARTILVVDDEANMLATLQFILEAAGYRVACAGGGPAALELWEVHRMRGEPPDLVITDVQMPGMTGPELLAELARRGSRAPALVITGYSDRAVLDRLRQAGCGELLEKPFEEGDLLSRVSSLLGGARP